MGNVLCFLTNGKEQELLPFQLAAALIISTKIIFKHLNTNVFVNRVFLFCFPVFKR